ncbi:hypothetical protein GCM10010172_32970 [Paractinoplanes ferrugineus]|uniref:Uncharacterized protein n=1 Tax=Paractinoplanes ferrugineus TaxID=113564 RepID=A0A919J7L0_9ACTN|nr:hypothetical protein [Actinoplanes ferrugineus]GIE14772.1 hypothetical protein Afe05nite_66120 [Actinoplanes ferrugineus]
MLTRRSAAVLGLIVCLAGCANQTSPSASAAASASAAGPASSSGPAFPSGPASSGPAAASSAPGTTGPETVSGTVEAGVEPGCLLVQDSKGTHLLLFGDAAMRTDTAAAVGKKVTLTGRSEPTMKSTCQQGVPFIVTSVTPA